MTNPKFRVERFDKASHDRGAFSCGVAGMDRWFKESITDQIKANRLRVWCAVDPEGRVVGFYGLSAHSVEAEVSPALSRRRERHPIPAVYLAVLATDLTVQGQGLGGALMADALTKALEVSETIGAAAVILDVFEDERFEQRMAFYMKLGFRPLNPADDPKRLFLPMTEMAAAYSVPLGDKRQKLLNELPSLHESLSKLVCVAIGNRSYFRQLGSTVLTII